MGLASGGIHSNGYSLVRKLFFDIKKFSPKKKIKELGCTIGEELLRPTRIYVKSVLKIIDSYTVKGIAHITGGGLTENLPRILPRKERLKFVIEKESWPVHNIFRLIQQMGNVTESEMFTTFNMGIGMVLIVKQSDARHIVRRLKRLGEDAFIIGKITKGNRSVKYI